MPYTQKYCLVSFLIPIPERAEFNMSDWPFHITLADVFWIDLNKTAIREKLKALLAKQSPVITSATADSLLGKTKIVLVKKTNNLLSLHTSLTSLLVANGAEFNTPEFMLDGFLPHYTNQKAGKLNIGDELNIDAIALVDMFPNNNWQQRKILANFKLLGQ